MSSGGRERRRDFGVDMRAVWVTVQCECWIVRGREEKEGIR